MNELPARLDPRRSDTAPDTASRVQAEEMRMYISVGLAHHMHVLRALLGQSRQEFVTAALVRHIEALGHLKLDPRPAVGEGIAVVVARRDEGFSTLEPAAPPSPAPADSEVGA